MNQMTTKFGGDGGRSQLVPALGARHEIPLDS